ncbi:hypothetical protein RGQ29_000708 [Quercus rubra]|uniref:Uncharacterized protein n=1 Tax=Quercus rubra TaxID=3512 RepID=A0AAN7JDB7_QUERU|nr:hypothetical protein RGQ29_000708 [Quercus rubra]
MPLLLLVRRIRLVAVATQKFVSEVAGGALQYCYSTPPIPFHHTHLDTPKYICKHRM